MKTQNPSRPEPPTLHSAPADLPLQPSKSLVRRLGDLARPGAVAVDRGDVIAVETARRPHAARRQQNSLARTEFAALAAAGWIEPCPDTPAEPGNQVWRLAATGRAALRAAVLAPAAPRPAKTRRRKVASDRETPAHRPPLLDLLHARRDAAGAPLISAEHVAAGQRLAEDFHRACLQPRVTQSWDAAAFAARTGFSGRGGVGERDASAQAHVRVQRALDAVGGDLAGLVVDVCCFDIGLTQCERDRGWSESTARIVLRHALQRLAEHYGIVTRRSTDIARYIRHWSDGDYRPGTDRWTT